MKTLYLDCGMGAAGDMLCAALLELMPDREAAIDRLNRIGIPGVRFIAEKSVKCGITGTHLRVEVEGVEEGGHEHHHEHEHGHSHSGIADIEHIVKEHLDLSEKVKADVLAVFGLIAEAESKVHGVPMKEIHFHEVGTLDAVADIAAFCCLIDELAPEHIAASPVHVGSGQVRCAHGILPVPAPATALILRGVPIYGGSIEGELCTPTGAALLKRFVTSFGSMPVMRTEAIGCGMGKRDYPAANCVRAMLGETEGGSDTVTELVCNVDDMTAEAVSFACEKLFEAGALEVFTLPAGMKKGRPGTEINALCRPADREKLVRTLFRHTTTIGVRTRETERFVLERRTENTETELGPVRKKVSEGFGVRREKYEYEDIARIANERGCSLEEAVSLIDR